MAIFHYRMGERVSRGAGQSAVRIAAYQARERLQDERTGYHYNYRPTLRQAQECEGISAASDYIERAGAYAEGRRAALFVGLYAPSGAPDWCRGRENIETFWSRAELAERRQDAQIAERIIIALPHELTLQQNIWLLQDHVKEFTRQGRVVQVAIHEPEHSGPGAERNVHAHLLVSLRGVDTNGFKATKTAEQQQRYLHRRDYVTDLRQKWADTTNRHLGRHGHTARIDHRTLAEQGIDRAPTIHLGPGDSRRERQGERSAAGEVNREISAQNAEQARQSLDRVHAERHPAPQPERAAEVVDLDAWRRELEQQPSPAAQEAARYPEAAHAPAAPATAPSATAGRQRATEQPFDYRSGENAKIAAEIAAWRRGLEREWQGQPSPVRLIAIDQAREAENARLEQEVWSDRKPGSRDPLTIEDLIRALSPAYVEVKAAIEQERAAIEKAAKIRDAAEQHAEVAAYRQDERRQEMGLVRRLAHKIGLWIDAELSKWKLADTFAEKGTERWSTRGRTAEDRLAYFERQAATEFAAVKPAAERELAQRQDRAEKARAELGRRGLWITEPEHVGDGQERDDLIEWHGFQLGKLREADQKRQAQKAPQTAAKEQKQAPAAVTRPAEKPWAAQRERPVSERQEDAMRRYVSGMIARNRSRPEYEAEEEARRQKQRQRYGHRQKL